LEETLRRLTTDHEKLLETSASVEAKLSEEEARLQAEVDEMSTLMSSRKAETEPDDEQDAD